MGFVFPEVLLSWSVSYCEFSCTYNTSVKLWMLCHLSHTNSYQLSHKSYTTHVLLCCVLWSSVLSRDVVVFGLFCCAFICFVFCVLSCCCVALCDTLVFVSCCVCVVCVCVCCVYVVCMWQMHQWCLQCCRSVCSDNVTTNISLFFPSSASTINIWYLISDKGRVQIIKMEI